MSWKPLNGTAAVRPSRLMAEHSTTGLPLLGAIGVGHSTLEVALVLLGQRRQAQGCGRVLGAVVLLFAVGPAPGDAQQREAEQSGQEQSATHDETTLLVSPAAGRRARARRPGRGPARPRPSRTHASASRDWCSPAPPSAISTTRPGPRLTSWRRTGPGTRAISSRAQRALAVVEHQRQLALEHEVDLLLVLVHVHAAALAGLERQQVEPEALRPQLAAQALEALAGVAVQLGVGHVVAAHGPSGV